jgi:hypothetical protein
LSKQRSNRRWKSASARAKNFAAYLLSLTLYIAIVLSPEFFDWYTATGSEFPLGFRQVFQDAGDTEELRSRLVAGPLFEEADELGSHPELPGRETLQFLLCMFQ